MDNENIPATRQQLILKQNLQVLGNLAWQNFIQGIDPNDFVLICIDADSDDWNELTDHFFSNQTRQEIKTTGHIPVLCASVGPEILQILSKIAPSMKDIFSERLGTQTARVIVCSHGISYVTLKIVSPTTPVPPGTLLN